MPKQQVAASVGVQSARRFAGILNLAWLPGVEPGASPRGLDLLGFEVAAFMHERDDEDLPLAQVIEDAPGIGGNLAHLLVVEFGDFAAAEGRGLDAVGAERRCDQFTTMRSPLLDLARESLAGDHAAGVDILYPLMNLVEYKEPIDDLIEGGVIGQAFDGLDGLLFSGVGVHRFCCADYCALRCDAVSSISMTKRCLARGICRGKFRAHHMILAARATNSAPSRARRALCRECDQLRLSVPGLCLGCCLGRGRQYAASD